MIKANVKENCNTLSETVISVCDVSKAYRLYPSHQDRLKEAFHPFRKIYHRDFLALNNITFDIHRGECVGILGRNGAGKSTLLQLITGVVSPTSGSISIAGEISALLELGAGFNPDLTGRENVKLSGEILGVFDNDLLDRVATVESFADIGQFFDQPMKTYSSGMYARVAFANAIHGSPDVLIVDEILGVGDAKFQEKCYRKLAELRTSGVSILFVSHAINTILDICDRCILLEKGEICFSGKASEAVNAYHNLLFGKDTPEPTNKVGSTCPHKQSLEINTNEFPATNSQGIQPHNVEHILNWLVHDTSLENRVDTRLSYNKNNHRMGNKSASLIDYIIISGTDVDATFIPTGANVDIYLKVLFHEYISTPIVGMAITKINGTGVFGTKTSLMRRSLAPREANEFSVYHFHFVNNLAGGEYFLNFGIETTNDAGVSVFIDNFRSIAHLIFEATPSITGVANVGCSFEEIC